MAWFNPARFDAIVGCGDRNNVPESSVQTLTVNADHDYIPWRRKKSM